MEKLTKKEYVKECIIKEHLVKEHLPINNIPEKCLSKETAASCRPKMDCDGSDPTCVSMGNPEIYADLFSEGEDTDWTLIDTCNKNKFVGVAIGKFADLPAYLDSIPEFSVPAAKSPKRRRY